jgi:hypothetical protein
MPTNDSSLMFRTHPEWNPQLLNIKYLMLSATDLSSRAISAEYSRPQLATIPARQNALTMFEGVQTF